MKKVDKQFVVELIEKCGKNEDFVYTMQEIKVAEKYLGLKERSFYISEIDAFEFMIQEINLDNEIRFVVLAQSASFAEEVLFILEEVLKKNEKVTVAYLIHTKYFEGLKERFRKFEFENEVSNCSYCYEKEKLIQKPDSIKMVNENDYEFILTLNDDESGIENFYKRIFVSKELKDEKMYVIHEKGLVVGYLLRHSIDEMFDDVGYIYITPSKRKKGFGKQLLNYFVAVVKEEGKVPYYGFAETEISARTALSVGYTPCAESLCVTIKCASK